MSAAYAICYTYLLWVLFLAVMSVKAANDAGTLSRTVLTLAVPLVIAAYVIDVAFNWTLACLLFLETPQEPTLSQRVSRLRRSCGWRAPVAQWVCANLLDPFQIGGHCH